LRSPPCASRSGPSGRRVLLDLLRGSVERSPGVAIHRWHGRRRASSGDGRGMSMAWIVLGRWGCWSGQALCERTNKPSRRGFVGAASLRTNKRRRRGFVRSFASFAGHGGRGFIDPFVRSFAGARDMPKPAWLWRRVDGGGQGGVGDWLSRSFEFRVASVMIPATLSKGAKHRGSTLTSNLALLPDVTIR
jgi:hypothetical protein